MNDSEAADTFGELVGLLDRPMIVVTARDEQGTAEGCLVGFHAQCSIDPPGYLVMISVNNRTHGAACTTDRLGVSFLADDQYEVGRLFGEESGDWTDKFARCEWHDEAGVPVIDGCAGWFVGEVVGRHEVGDHTAHVLAPIAVGHRGPAPMLAADVVIPEVEPGHEAGLSE